MQTTSQLLTELDIIKLLSSLCEVLSQNNQSSKGCSSERLLENAPLRDNILRKAAQSDDPQLRRIAYKLLRVDFDKAFSQSEGEKSTLNAGVENKARPLLMDKNKESNRQLILMKLAVAGLSLIVVVTVGLLLMSNLNDVFSQH